MPLIRAAFAGEQSWIQGTVLLTTGQPFVGGQSRATDTATSNQATQLRQAEPDCGHRAADSGHLK